MKRMFQGFQTSVNTYYSYYFLVNIMLLILMQLKLEMMSDHLQYHVRSPVLQRPKE